MNTKVEQDEAITTTTRLFRELTGEEQDLLRQMQKWAETASRKADAKARELLNWIHLYIKPDGKWSKERVIIFTEYRATQKWLYQLLAGEGFVEGERLMSLYGGMNSDDREKVKAAFQASPDISPVRILLATDAASEGLDLQNHCHRLIHYEIPWNPNRMEQRNGRIDRHGQKANMVVKVGLEIAQQPALIPVKGIGIDGKVFHLPPLKSSWAVCSEGLAHPHTKEIRPLVFDPELAHGKDDVVLAHLNHRLVQMCLRLLRAEVWSKEGKKGLHRVTARLVPNSVLEAPAVIAYGRLVILGSDQQRLHEELIITGGLLKQGRFKRMGVMEVQLALNAALPDIAPENIREKLVQLWDKNSEALMQSLQKRKEERAESLQNQLDKRAEKEIEDITAILTELQRSITAELNEPEYKQLELFNTNEKEQFERNINSLKVRLEQIPAEIEREVAAIEARFANPTPRLFPLAVTYLIPQKLVK
ncbi:MAG: helicase-related protein [Rivularia sp. (in: cyanobacteria)]